MGTSVKLDPPMLVVWGPTVQNPDELPDRLVVAMPPVVAPVVRRKDEGEVTISFERER